MRKILSLLVALFAFVSVARADYEQIVPLRLASATTVLGTTSSSLQFLGTDASILGANGNTGRFLMYGGDSLTNTHASMGLNSSGYSGAGGSATLGAGATSGANLTLYTGHATSSLNLATGGFATTRFSIDGTTGEFLQNATNGGSVVLPRGDAKPLINGAASLDSDASVYSGTEYLVNDGTTQVIVGNGNADNGNDVRFLKTRGTGTDANTIVQNGDTLGSIQFYGASGTAFVRAGAISSKVDGTPGSGNDMPGVMLFYTTPDGSGTMLEALRLDRDQNALFGQKITSGRSTDIGWSVVNVANQACNTTCTNACVVGIDTGSTTSAFLGCTDATADSCLCAGAS